MPRLSAKSHNRSHNSSNHGYNNRYMINQPYAYSQPVVNPSLNNLNPVGGSDGQIFPVSMINPQNKTTVFVGSIDTQAPDEMIIRMLRTCGAVADWKRASSAGGTMQPFGFVKFEDYESTLRAIRVMNGLKIGEKILVVKLSAHEQNNLDKYKEQKRDFLVKSGQQIVSAQNWQDKSVSAEDADKAGSPQVQEVLTQDEVQYDKNVALKLKNIVKEYDDYFKNPLLHQSVSQNFLRSTMARHMQTRDVLHNNTYENDNVVKETKEIDEKADEVKTKLTLKSGPDVQNEISEESEPDTIASSLIKKPAESSQPKLAYTDAEGNNISDPVQERKTYLKKLKEKARSYATMLKKYEARERRQQKVYIYEENEVETTKMNYSKNFEKELKFFAEYDDETMDKKHFHSRRFSYKISEREVEYKNDREIAKQIDSIQKNPYYNKFIQHLKYIHKDIDAKFAQEDSLSRSSLVSNEVTVQQIDELDEEIKKLGQKDTKTSSFKPISSVDKSDQQSPRTDSEINNDNGLSGKNSKIESGTPNSSKSPAVSGLSQLKIVLSRNSGQNGPSSDKINKMLNIIGAGGVFDNVFAGNDADDTSTVTPSSNDALAYAENAENVERNNVDLRNSEIGNSDSAFDATEPKKLKLMPIDFEAEKQKEAKCHTIYNIIDTIPTDNHQLFGLKLNWDLIDDQVIQSNIYPWLVKKVTEYIGEPEKVLLDFICDKLSAHCSAEELTESLRAVLDDEAISFTANLWRLLIYTQRALEADVLK